MTSYPEYKEAGIRWITHVPKHWDVKPLFAIMSENKISNKGNIEQNVLSLSYGKIIRRDLSENFGLLPASFETYQIIHPGYIVLRLTDLQNDWNSLRVGLVKEKGIITSAYVGLESSSLLDSTFAYYLLHAYDLVKVFYGEGAGVRQSMTYKDLRRMPIIVPPLPEQQAIANFLDRKTAQIKTLIEKKQQQIDLLQEQRTVLINHAVTKGLNPDVRMKDSGMEWLGEIPSHWYVVPMRRMLDVRDGTHETPEYVESNGESIPFVTSKDFDGDSINFETAKRISLEDHQNFTRRSKVEKGDVLMSMIGGNIGKALIVSDNFDFSIKNVALLKTYGDVELSKYILYYIRSGLLDTQIGIQSRGGAQSFLSLTDIRNLIFFKLPKQEYASITNFLDEQTNNIERQIRMIQKEINLIQEYRTALISEAVTGKIDVRNLD